MHHAATPLPVENKAPSRTGGEAFSRGQWSPIMTDAGDMVSGIDNAVFLQTDSRREGGGYVIRRGYYPKNGFFFRKSKSEKELEEAPNDENLTPPQKKSAAAKAEAEAQKAPLEMVWSDHLERDIAQLREEEQESAYA